MTKLLIAIGVASLVVAACSSGDGGSASTTAPLVTTTVVSSPAPDSTTTSLTSSTTSTTETTTTLPETTTTVATEDVIKQAVQDYSEAYHQCGAAPASCVPENFTATQGHSRSTVTELATGMTQQGLYFSTDLRGSYLVAESVTIESPTEATAIYCAYDAGAVMGPNGPDGLPTVVNDQILSLRNEYRLFMEDGIWRVGEQLQLAVVGEGSLCPPAA
jgi:hypothetical protein